MDTILSQVIDSFARLRILVIGEAMLDSYLAGVASGLSREAPVPVVSLIGREDVPGGAANTAANVSGLGAHVHFLSVIGHDEEGERLGCALEQRGVGTAHLIRNPARRTLAKHRLMAATQMLVRFDQGDTTPLDRATEQAVIEQLTDLFPSCDAVIVSDYSYGILTHRVIKTLAQLQSTHPCILVVDSRNPSMYRNVGVTAVKPNYQEVVELLGIRDLGDPRARANTIALYADQLLDETGARIAAVTLDIDGAVIFERGSPPYRTYARPVQSARAVGAGDTYVSALTLALAAGADTPAAAELAASAAAIVVGSDGTVTCPIEQLQAYIADEAKYIVDREHLAARVALYRQQGARIVFTNGCFDILHRGHVTYLSRAKALGDVLILGVNTDAGIRRLKGPQRPINPLEDRVQVLAALSCVDHIVAFDEDTPIELIQAIRPDVFVKGGDYTRDRLPEATVVEELGGIVEILPYLQERSTTGLIERIRAA